MGAGNPTVPDNADVVFLHDVTIDGTTFGDPCQNKTGDKLWNNKDGKGQAFTEMSPIP